MRLLAPLLRWLDRRIDARIAARVGAKPPSAGLQRLTDEAARDIRATTTVFDAKEG